MKKPKILIVDDDPMCVDIYSTKLRSSGYEVICTDSGETAHGLALAEQPDAILLDVLMPNIGGQEVLRQLKADAATKHIPVIMLSVMELKDGVQAAMEHGAACYLFKTDLTPQQIIEELDRCMK